jgi:predicted DNA-binding transcriptional regulator AlpA
MLEVRNTAHLTWHAHPVPIEIDGLEYLDRNEVASRLNVAPSTVSGWASRGQMPGPDRYVGRSPLWLLTSIMEWEDNRPGKGWRASD